MPQKYTIEKAGQQAFFQKFGIADDTAVIDSTDGIRKGCIFEFKLAIGDLNKVLFQAIKYLSKERIKGHNVPATILLVDLNAELAYKYNSDDFLSEIETIYVGGASTGNAGFSASVTPQKIDYSHLAGIRRIGDILEDEQYTKIHIDVFCVVAWAERFYSECTKATKIQMFAELRSPAHFKDLIYAWQGEEQDFKYIMDCLNDKMHKKELGAFYTPPAYCKKATELVRRAIAQIPQDHDYIILDRCAGTGNLEEFLTDKPVDDITIGELHKYLAQDFIAAYLKDKATVITAFYSDKDFNSITLGELEAHKTKHSIRNHLCDNELSHCIVNTYELKEWVVLNRRIGDRVKMIIPPPCEISNIHSVVKGGDALSENFIVGRKTALFDMTEEYYSAIDALNAIVQTPNVNVIMFENPPYRVEKVGSAGEDVGKEEQTRRNRTESFVRKEMENNKINGEWAGDLGNQFIWSAFRYYMAKPNDSYVVFSPVKYFKSAELVGKKFMAGYLFNRLHFHATPSAISCILWGNSTEKGVEWSLDAYDIADNKAEFILNQNIKRCYHTFNDKLKDGYIPKNSIDIACSYDGYENTVGKKQNRYLFDDDMIAALEITGWRVDPQSYHLTRIINYRGRGMYLSKNNYLEKLPLFCAKLYPQTNWYERDIYFTTADGGDRYTKDADFLRSCFIFTCLSPRNHCLSFNGSDGRYYKNELCFDAGTLASSFLRKQESPATTEIAGQARNDDVSNAETELLSIFAEILKLAKCTANYNAAFSYGTYQIDQELNTRHKDDADVTVYDYPELNTKIVALKAKLARYYEEVIQPRLFEYELLK
jgi:hypothetical protein